ncbi:MAG TPA: HAD hydrolase family protein, partial [Mobilitalea sp.]|nr:HAD hydrolase family protein [Mobilitalea sp.]
ILKDLKLTLPVILMNGVCIYDPVNLKYINVETLNKENVRILISLIEENNLKGFMYAIKNETLATYYEDLSNKAMRDFYEIRVKRYKKPFTKVNKFAELEDEPIIYFVLMDYKEKLEPIYRLVENRPNINCVFYKDNYEKDMWYLEIFSNKASKYHAVQYLRKYLSVDYVIGFGDNQNDLSLFEACDKCYAVNNAIEELKQRADAVIGKNTEDGVAMWLKRNV